MDALTLLLLLLGFDSATAADDPGDPGRGQKPIG
jgi:hypothetical protein